jgi:phosphate propanoyltransferase
MDHDLITKLTGQVIAQMRQRTIPLGISNRHVHLSAKITRVCFPDRL